MKLSKGSPEVMERAQKLTTAEREEGRAHLKKMRKCACILCIAHRLLLKEENVEINLTDLIHTQWDGKSALKLYIYNHDGYHHGGQWFRDEPDDEEITTAELWN